jgi:hypothetical protein
MATSAAVGQAAGTAAYICAAENLLPSQIRNAPEKMKQLQQILLLDNQAIVNAKNEDPKDLAKLAKVTASSSALETSPENVINGVAIELKNERKNRWIADAGKNPVLELKWDKPQNISRVQITFDAGTRELTMSKNINYVRGIHWGPQPEIVKDFAIVGVTPDGKEEVISEVKDNWRRLFRTEIPVKKYSAIKLQGFKTNGDKYVRIAEVRAYS